MEAWGKLASDGPADNELKMVVATSQSPYQIPHSPLHSLSSTPGSSISFELLEQCSSLTPLPIYIITLPINGRFLQWLPQAGCTRDHIYCRV